MSLFDDASLVLTPNGYKEGKLYSIKPTDGSGDLDVVRATTATRVNSEGLIEVVPRNLITYSNDFTTWVGSGYITPNYAISPDGSNNASRCLFTGASQILSKASSLSTGVACSATMYVKGTAGETIQLAAGGADTLHTLNGNWQRLETNKTSLNSTILLNTFGGSTARDLLVWGAQLEAGSVATSYFPTTDRLNIPRLDYTNGSCPSILVEPQRTNVLLRSEEFDNAYWINNGATIIANDTTSPDGTTNADRLTATGGGFGIVRFSTWNATNKVASCFVKANTSNIFRIANVSASGGSVTFNLSTLNITATTGFTGTIEVFKDGWFRCTAIDTLGRSGTFSLGVTSVSESVYIWGAQLEAGSYATSYIPTVGSTVTRNADVISKTGISDLINSTEGVLYAEIKGFISQDTIEPNRYITLTNGTSNERVALLLGGNINQLRAIIYSSTQSINLSFTTSLTDVKQYNKLAVKYKSGDYAFFLNGVKIGGSIITNAFSANTLNDLSFDVGGGTQQFRGNTKDVRVYNTALTDLQLQQLTTI